MKKIILSLLLLAGLGLTTMAQTPTPVSNTSVIVPVYSPPVPDPVYVAPVTTVTVPVYVDRSFKMTYPAASRTVWYRVNDDWWRVTYMDNGPWLTLGYDTRGISYPIALPVLETAIPNDVVNAVVNRFNSVYDISETIGSNYQTQYLVRTLGAADGQVKTWRVNAAGIDVPQ
jgi:hypothetical protein